MDRLGSPPPLERPYDDLGRSAGPARRLVPLFAAYLADCTVEHAAVAGFDGRGRLRYFCEVAGDAHTVQDIIPAIRSVLAELSVTELVLAHNHPQTSACPSPLDAVTTERLAALARLAGTMLIDHLIFGDDGVFSLSAGRHIVGITQ